MVGVGREQARTLARSAGPGILRLPEVNVAIFAFLLNFVWEFWQVPFFEGMAAAPHWDAVQFCTGATLGDAGIALVGFWAVAAVRSRAWILRPTSGEVIAFTAVGVAITLPLEWLATEVLRRWTYAEIMPTLPLLGTGLLPLLQWTVLPPLIVWFVRRQLT
ncbi:MAG TPA: hypothetical protein VGR37_21920 [Longimicrobiaceae bacterium]|nr:hypothetical protein [Longimicrobiaceae bacterium]